MLILTDGFRGMMIVVVNHFYRMLTNYALSCKDDL